LKPVDGIERLNEHVMTLLLYLALSAMVPSSPQQPTSLTPAQPAAEASQNPSPPPINATELPVSLDRIQRALSRPPTIRVNTSKPTFRIEVFGKNPTILDFLGTDFLRGPYPAGAMTHQEFLNMVTPNDVGGYAAFSNREGLVVAATSLALQWALQKAIHKFNDAKKEREREAARREVMDALAALQRARAKAGLPPK
jgi:hypothetical protein